MKLKLKSANNCPPINNSNTNEYSRKKSTTYYKLLLYIQFTQALMKLLVTLDEPKI